MDAFCQNNIPFLTQFGAKLGSRVVPLIVTNKAWVIIKPHHATHRFLWKPRTPFRDTVRSWSVEINKFYGYVTEFIFLHYRIGVMNGLQ